MTPPTKTLPANAPDDVINALVAEHVAGWTKHPRETKECYDSEGNHTYWSNVPEYATSADAVLPLLDKAGAVTAGLNPNSLVWRVQILTGPCGGIAYACRHRSFARAASLALLMAHGFTIANPPAT